LVAITDLGTVASTRSFSRQRSKRQNKRSIRAACSTLVYSSIPETLGESATLRQQAYDAATQQA
jgi:hypothetical protein